MNNKLDLFSILPLEGLGLLRFGASLEEVLGILGKPSNLTDVDVQNSKLTSDSIGLTYERWDVEDVVEASWTVTRPPQYDFVNPNVHQRRFLQLKFDRVIHGAHVLSEISSNSRTLVFRELTICGTSDVDVIEHMKSAAVEFYGGIDAGHREMLLFSHRLYMISQSGRVRELTWHSGESPCA